jgi:FMN phosphatase YigB (HAD superfamily)
VDPKKFVDALLGGTKAMVKNRRPDCTLKDVFDEHFFPALQLNESDFRGIADRFYSEVFPQLRSLTRPRPEAVELVQGALARGCRVAIATNPLFPKTAILQRLEWANLPAEKFHFAIISSYDKFHFAKPDPAFFAEMMAYLGWPEGPAVIVGDDFNLDIVAGSQLGFPTFWVGDHNQPALNQDTLTGSGSLADVLPWLSQAGEAALTPAFNTPSAILTTLRATSAALSSICQQIPASVWTQRPQADEWSLTELMCHLRDVEQEVNLPRIQKLLQEENPFLPGKDTDPWAVERNYIQQNGSRALNHFIQARSELAGILEQLSSEDWQRSSRHAIFGPTHLVEIAGIIAGHDRLHLRQVTQLVDVIGSPN